MPLISPQTQVNRRPPDWAEPVWVITFELVRDLNHVERALKTPEERP